ncbi:MAG: hypothetical protein ACI32C_00935 [Candidatus Enteromonas sp.]
MYNNKMNWQKLLEETREQWAKESLLLNKDERRYIEGKYSTKTKMLGCFSPSYHKRGKLVLSSQVYYGLVFKSYRRPDSDSEYYPIWVLWSPNRKFQEDPTLYDELLPLLETRYGQKKKWRREKVELALHEKYADASMLLIDPGLTKGIPVYLSILYFHKDHVFDFRLGINLFLANQDVSKELLVLPERFWSEAYAEAYARYFKETEEDAPAEENRAA